MKRARCFLWWLSVALPLLGTAHGASFSTNLSLPCPSIVVDPSSAPVAGFGKATLIIGALRRNGTIFCGNYQVKVYPYSYKNEKGRLVIFVSDQAIREIAVGNPIAVTGTATTDETGKSRAITVTALPKNNTTGILKISFVAGKKKMIFESVYRLADNKAD